MKIITNHVYSLKDYQELIEVTLLEEEDKIIDIFFDLDYLEKALSSHSQHFFDCLKYLLKNGRLEILPVKFNNVDLSRCKRMILFDGKEYITTEGNIIFTLPALLKNSESFQVETHGMGSEKILEKIRQGIVGPPNFVLSYNQEWPQSFGLLRVLLVFVVTYWWSRLTEISISIF